MKFYLPFELPFNKRQFIYLLKGVYDLHFKLKKKKQRENEHYQNKQNTLSLIV